MFILCKCVLSSCNVQYLQFVTSLIILCAPLICIFYYVCVFFTFQYLCLMHFYQFATYIDQRLMLFLIYASLHIHESPTDLHLLQLFVIFSNLRLLQVSVIFYDLRLLQVICNKISTKDFFSTDMLSNIL